MLKMQYLFPVNLPKPDGVYDPTFVPLIMSLSNVHKKPAAIPHSKLLVKLNFFTEGASLHIHKGKELVYINVFCVQGNYGPKLFNVVQKLYQTYNLGFAQMPAADNWIHSVPVNYKLLSEREVRLAEKITTAFYWGIYAKITGEGKPLN